MPAQLLTLAPHVRRRIGVDLDPVVVTTEEGALRRLLADRAADALTVVLQAAALGYLDAEGWARVRDALDESGRDGSLAFVWTARPAGDIPHWGLWLQLWPDGAPRLRAFADFHGAWLEWLA